MASARVVFRLLQMAFVTGFFYPILVANAIFLRRSSPLRVRCRDFVFRNWSRALLRILNARVESEGRGPEPPFFLVANHLSYIDILVLATRVDAVFVAKSEIASWPLVGQLCRAVDTVFVDRALRRDVPRVIAEIDRLLARNQGVILFPEGTSTPGYEVAPFRPSLLEVAARTGRPVSFAALSYSTECSSRPAHLAVSWWGGTEFVPHFLSLLALPGFSATVSFGDKVVVESDRKLLAERLHSAVASRFVPVVTRAEQAGSV